RRQRRGDADRGVGGPGEDRGRQGGDAAAGARARPREGPARALDPARALLRAGGPAGGRGGGALGGPRRGSREPRGRSAPQGPLRQARVEGAIGLHSNGFRYLTPSISGWAGGSAV